MHLVITYKDISNCYQGIDDIEIILCDTKKKADEIYKKKINDIFKYFKDTYEEYVEDLQYVEVPGGMQIFNDKDYITCQIRKQEVI